MDWGLKALVIQAHGSAMAQVSDSSLTLGLQIQSAPPVNTTAFTLPVSASLALCAPLIDVAAIVCQGDLGDFQAWTQLNHRPVAQATSLGYVPLPFGYKTYVILLHLCVRSITCLWCINPDRTSGLSTGD
jgi:hypothetical protein